MDRALEGLGCCLPGVPQSSDFWVLVQEAVQAQGRYYTRSQLHPSSGKWCLDSLSQGGK